MVTLTPQSQNVHKLPQKRISQYIVTNPLEDGLFLCALYEYFDETSWLSTAYMSLCQDGIRVWNHFPFM